MGFKGSKFTWWNDKTDKECIFKKLDRVMCNLLMLLKFVMIKVEHLFTSGSDQAPLLIYLKNKVEEVKKCFRFLNSWI